MYDKNEILDLETKILSICTYYSYIQISFNNYCQNYEKNVIDVCQKVASTKIVIEALRSLLFKLTPIKYSKSVNYNEIAIRLHYLGSLSRKKHFHNNEMIWNSILSTVEISSFSSVFGHFISRLRALERKFDGIPDKYKNLSLAETKKFEEDLLSLSTYIQDFISYVQAVKIMLAYVDKEQLLAKASYDEDFVIPKKEKPTLRLIKSSTS